MRQMLAVAAVMAWTAAGAVQPGPAAARPAAPPEFFGVVSQGELTEADFARMRAGGVAKVRFPVDWYAVEPAPGEFDFSRLDRLAALSARYGVRLFPFISGTAGWFTPDPAEPPIGSRAQRDGWRTFLREFVGRYAPGGEFWRDREEVLPIRDWQVWNEPNFTRFFHPRPSARQYGRLVRISADAIRAADPAARVILGGVAPVHRGPLPTDFLERLYRVDGIKRSFDAVALHPYAPTTSNVLRQIHELRGVMRRAGDSATPIEVTELGWASEGPEGFGLVKGRAGQARILRQSIGMLVEQRRRLRIAGFQWFAWQDAPQPESRCAFCQHSGLFTFDRRPKPSWRAFKRLAREAG